MKILFISARLPYPLNNGAKIRAYHLLKSLARRHQVTLLTFYGNEGERSYFPEIESLGVRIVPVLNSKIDKQVGIRELLQNVSSPLPLTVQKYSTPVMGEMIGSILSEGYDVVHCEHLHVAHYLWNIPQIRKVMDAHNVEAQIAERHAAVEGNPLKRFILKWNFRKMLEYEMKSVRSMDLVLAVSGNDQATFKKQGGDNARVLENGVDLSYFLPQESPDNRKSVFVGSMDWAPNVDGVIYFVGEILPLIRSVHPDFELSVVGKEPHQHLIALTASDPLLHVTGTVDDVRPYIADASVYIVPLQFGGGTRLKILEAFAMGKAVVSTSLGCEGIDCRDGEHILIADTPREFADAVIRLFADGELKKRLSANAARLVKDRYGWETIGARLLAYYEALA